MDVVFPALWKSSFSSKVGSVLSREVPQLHRVSAPALSAGCELILDQLCRDLAPFWHLDGQEEGGGSSDGETGWISYFPVPLTSLWWVIAFTALEKKIIRGSMTSGFFGISVQESCRLLTGAQWKKNVPMHQEESLLGKWTDSLFHTICCPDLLFCHWDASVASRLLGMSTPRGKAATPQFPGAQERIVSATAAIHSPNRNIALRSGR